MFLSAVRITRSNVVKSTIMKHTSANKTLFGAYNVKRPGTHEMIFSAWIVFALLSLKKEQNLFVK